MPKDKRALLEVLKSELEFLQKAGYDTSVRKSWRPGFVFEDSPTCLNAGLHENRLPCDECILMQVTPPERRGEKVPCRYIPLKETGETIDYYYRCGSQKELEEALAEWLRKTIHRLEEQRTQENASGRKKDDASTSTAPEK